jgi:GWxTD domain-containing protein
MRLGFCAAFVLLVSAEAVCAGTPGWLDSVNPILTSTEKKLYLSLTPAEQESFEKDFWNGKTITAQEYFERVQYADLTFGSGKPGSGANTDQGRVYVALGAPTKVAHFASSRIFVPIDIWYYDVVPGYAQTEIRLAFYRKNSLGFPKLYSPNRDTIRVLLLPEAATVHMFGPNDTLDEAAIRNILRVPPAEDEVVAAAAGVASGIKGSGTDELLAKVASPRTMLRKELVPGVQSRFLSTVPKLRTVLTPSPYGGVQADFSMDVSARGALKFQVLQGNNPIYQNAVDLHRDLPEAVQYLGRLDLLPGSYRIVVTADGSAFPFPLEVPPRLEAGTPFRASVAKHESGSAAPFEFDQGSFYPSEYGEFAIWPLAQPGEVTWTIRRGLEVVWRTKAPARQVAVLPLPYGALPPGNYRLEASSASATQYLDFENSKSAAFSPTGTLISYNANLAPSARRALLGDQWVLRGNLAEARRVFETAVNEAPSERAQIGLARVDALAGKWDDARERLRPLLAASPRNFDALCILAYIEAKLQDREVAAELYHRALEVQDSPFVREALSELQR